MIALVCLCVSIYGRRRCRKEEISGRVGGERYKVEVEVAVAVGCGLGVVAFPGIVIRPRLERCGKEPHCRCQEHVLLFVLEHQGDCPSD